MLNRSLAGLLIVAAAAWPAHAQTAGAAGDAAASPPGAAETAPGAAGSAPAVATEAPSATSPTQAAQSTVPASKEDVLDPLTPPRTDPGPAIAPGAAARVAAPVPAAVASPIATEVMARLRTWPDARPGGDRADMEALKAFYDAPGAQPLWVDGNGFTARALGAITALRRADTHGLDAAAFEIPLPPASGAAPAALAEAEIKLALAALKYARHARGGRIDPGSISQMVDMRPRPYEPKSLLEGFAATDGAEAYLESLHPQHAGFAALRTALAKSRSEAASADSLRRIVANMERWRWLPDDLGAFHVWDNIPEQVTRVYHDGKVALKERIVVGKTNTPTPVFSAPMKFVIFHPSWGVPEGIKANELGPMLRRAQANSSGGWLFGSSDGVSRALARHELRVYRGGQPVNPESVNWATADVRQFSFTQPPSAKNVLGIVKFRFPNRFDVYMHDTTERHLFSRSPRLYSHGCMRVENPLKLAETILGYDKGWGREKIAALAARGSTTDVTLDKNVPVHVVYFTAVADETGKLATLPDVYGLDSRVASALAGRSVALASAKAAPEETGQSSPAKAKEPAAKKTAQRVKSAKQQSSEPGFNPFAALSAN